MKIKSIIPPTIFISAVLALNGIATAIDHPELPEQGLNAIQPYKLNVMMKYASKIINQLVSIPNWLVSYDDIEFILEIVTNAIKKARANNE